MKKVNEKQIDPDHRISPKGTFELYRRHISLALGGKKDIGEWGGGHPFDIELTTLLPGKRNYPYHAHAAQWEYYIVISGCGKMLNGKSEWGEIEPGDHIICEPGEAHQIWNDGEEDLNYYVISDHHRADVATYPKTDKRFIKPDSKVIEFREVDYYEGEE